MHAPALVRLALLAVASLPVVLVGATPSTATTPDAGSVEEGTALPWRWEARLPYLSLAGASPDYVMHTRRQIDETRGPTYTIVRVSDGATVRTIERPDRNTPQPPALEGDAYVETVASDAFPYRVDHLDIHDVETDALTRIDLASHAGLVHGDDAWALVSDAGATSSSASLSFVWPDGHTVTVPDLSTAGRLLEWVGGDSDTAYVTNSDGTFALDPVTGQETRLALPDGSSFDLHAVTSTTLVGRGYAYVDGRFQDRYTVLDRASGALLGQVDRPRDTVLPYGRGLAVLSAPVGGPGDRYDLRPVDLATGALEPAVATDVAAWRPMGDGSVALAIGDVPTGRLAVAPGSGGAARPVADLPKIGYRSLHAGLSAGTVVSSFEGETGVWSTPTDGSGAWQGTYPGSTPADDRRGDFAFGGDTVLTEVAGTHPYDRRTYRIAWPGGSRDLESAGRPQLARGGDFLLRRIPGSSASWEVQDARSGTVEASGTDQAGHLLDGNWLWTGPDASGAMTGTDLTEREPDRTVDLPLTCSGKPASVYAVRGRWALTRCATSTVVDLWGVLKPWDLPAAGQGATLGEGFVAWVVTSTDATVGHASITLQVADLTEAHTTHTYGQLRGQYYPPGPDFAVDDSDRPDLVYVDPTYRLRRVRLDWLGTPPLVRDDTTAPDLASAPSMTPAIRSTRPVTLTPAWTYADPAVPHEPASGLDSYDVRVQPYPAPDATDPGWVAPRDWQGLEKAAVSVTLPPGEGRCFEARARDVRGNTSEWSAPACSYVDDTAPTLRPATGSPQLVPSTWTPLTYGYGADDDLAVASYDVAVRTAATGKALGSWRTRWAGTGKTSVGTSGTPGTEQCFRFRARDTAGNTSAWSTARCSTLPVDDTDLTTRGSVFGDSLDIAISGTYTELQSRGAAVTLPSQTGRTVALWVIRGPYQGPVDVYADGHRLGRVDLRAPWQQRAVVRLTAPAAWSGPVRVVSLTGAPARIDAIAVVR